MATATLNPNAQLFYPTATVIASANELSLIYSTCSPPPLQLFPAIIPQRYNYKEAIFFHPSLIYYDAPSRLSIFPNLSYYIPQPKYSIPTIIEGEPTEIRGDLLRSTSEFAGVEKQRLLLDVDAMEEQSMRTVSSSRFAIRGMRGRCTSRQFIKRSSQLWVRKSAENKSPEQAVFPVPDDLQFCDGAKNTVMIKNIPNKLSRSQMLDLLDQHCRDENMKINQEEGADMALSEFNFFYLPMDFISGNNLGYAFINFTSPAAAKRLYQSMHMMSWSSFGSRKTCEITHAKIQGLEELVKHFRRSIFACSSSEYLPLYFQPSRDGLRNTAEELVGKLVQR